MKRPNSELEVLVSHISIIVALLLSTVAYAEQPSDYAGGVVDEVSKDKIVLAQDDDGSGIDEKLTFLMTPETTMQMPLNYFIKTGDDVVVGFKNDGTVSTALNVLLVERSADIEHEAYLELHHHHKMALLHALKKDWKKTSARLRWAASNLSKLAKADLSAESREVVQSAEGLYRLAEAFEKGEIRDVQKLDNEFTRAKQSLKKWVVHNQQAQ